jgi:glycosyltransferase involved in cell wall biosynthesis
MSKPLVLVTAPVATRSGYGSHSRDICRSLISMDKYNVKIFPVRWGTTPQNALNDADPNDKVIIDRLMVDVSLERQPDVHIHIVIPNEFQPVAKYNIGITAGIETTACPPEWVEGMNRMDLNIVPSKFTKETLENMSFDRVDEQSKEKIGELKVNKPIEVLFEGTDTNIFKKTKVFSKELTDKFSKIKEDFCFLFVGHWLQGDLGNDRKDLGMLVKTFLETFKNVKNSPALLMKSSGATFSLIDKREMLVKIEDIKNTVDAKVLPNIYLLHGDLTDDEMNELYNHPKVKSHVTFTHGEGFGRPLLEASISQKPVIAPNWSGHVDFLTKNLSVLLSGSMKKVSKQSFQKGIYVKDSYWFTVNYQMASKVLKNVFQNYKRFALNSAKQGTINKSRFSLNKMTEIFKKILDDNVPEFPKEVKLKLPKLKKVKNTEPPKITLPTLKKVN